MSRRRVIATILLGVVGTAILVGLGVWQLQRLEWKQDLIARLEERLAAEPVALPDAPDPQRDAFLRVGVEGRLGEDAAYVLTSQRRVGAGYRVIAPLETAEGRRLLVDLGFVPDQMRPDAPLGREARVVGALYWPDEVDSFTPAPDREADLWFARDLEGMAEALGTEPLLVVADGHDLGQWPMPLRLGANVRNDHLGYAITWLSLALIWAVMSVLLMRGGRSRTV